MFMAVPDFWQLYMKIEVIWANFGLDGKKIPIVEHFEKWALTEA